MDGKNAEFWEGIWRHGIVCVTEWSQVNKED